MNNGHRDVLINMTNSNNVSHVNVFAHITHIVIELVKNIPGKTLNQQFFQQEHKNHSK